MEKDDVLGVMSSYDFSRPLHTVIYLEDNDCDEDTQIGNDNTSTDSKQSINNKEDTENGKTSDSNLDACYFSKDQTINPLSDSMNQIKKLSKSKSPKKKIISCNPSLQRAIDEDDSKQNNKKRCHAADETDPKKHDEGFNKSNHYIKSALKIISENILHIVAAKARINNKLLAATSIEQKHELDTSLITIKNSFFKMSYCVTVTMLLPLENNPQFINSLLHSTLQYARFLGMQSSHEELLTIYLEMLFWTKEYTHKCIPPLHGQNRQPEALTPYSSLNMPLTNRSPQTTISPRMGRAQPELINLQQCNGNHNSLQNTELLPKSKTCQSYVMNAQRQSFVPENGNRAIKNYSHMPPPYNAKQVHNISTNKNQSHHANQSRPNQNIQAHLLDHNSSPSRLSRQEGHSRRTNGNKTASPPYYAHIIVKTTDCTGNITPNLTITNRLPIQNDKNCKIRQFEGEQREKRSLSTDSGVASPLFTGTESMTDSAEQLNPLITEVTSLNPEVQYLNVGSCSVCQKPTRKVCLGCFKTYYCSFECMQSNWSYHRLNCANEV